MSEVLTIGEAMGLFAADNVGNLEDVEHFTRYLSGAELNVAVGLTRLKHSVSYFTHVGFDPFGKYLNKFLIRENIGTSYFKYDKNYPTGFQMKEKVLHGDPKVINFRKDSAASHITEKDIECVDWKSIRHLHLTGILPALSKSTKEVSYVILKKARENGLRITFDPNLRPALWTSKEEMIYVINDMASLSDIVLPGIKEGLILTGSDDPQKIADFYLEHGAKCVIVKLGSKGAYAKNISGEFTVPGFKVDKVVDSVGAGDGFAVGVISGLLEGLSLKDSISRGNAIGALQVMVQGDNEGLPDREKLESYMNLARSNI